MFLKGKEVFFNSLRDSLYYVLRFVALERTRGFAVILITHNVHHVFPVGNHFTILNRGRSMGTYSKQGIDQNSLQIMMVGGS